MNREQVQEIANAVLYEGYLLYPYRHTAIKNRQRWSIGIVYPREYSEANGGIEPCTMQTECLVKGSAATRLDIHIRFLHLLLRSVMEPESSSVAAQTEGENASEWSLASRMANEPWQEGMEREVNALNLSLGDLLAGPVVVEIAFAGGRMVEQAQDNPQAQIVREQQALTGTATITAERVGEDCFSNCALPSPTQRREPVISAINAKP